MHSTEELWAVLGHWEKQSPFSLTVWPMTGCLAPVGGALHPEPVFLYAKWHIYISPFFNLFIFLPFQRTCSDTVLKGWTQ